jgi:DNA-binding NarL/FixJ family response regulator
MEQIMNAVKPIQVMIIDDHKMVRDGIKASLAPANEIEIVDEADSETEALVKIADHPTLDVVIVDINLGESSGIEITKIVAQKYPNIRILALSMHDEINHIANMLEAGAIGYVLKNTGMNELIEAIKTVAAGKNYFSKEVSATLMNSFIRRKGNGPADQASSLEELTKREIEILRLIAEENTNQEIADKLFISPRTVDTHRRNLILKLDAKNTAGLVRFAIKHNLVRL